MSCIHSTGPVEKRVTATSTTEIFVPMTAWIPALGVDQVRFGLRLLADSGGLQGRPAYQTATAVVGESGSGGRDVPQGLGTPTTEALSSQSFAVNLGTVQYVRFGVLVSLVQGGAPGQADVMLQAQVPGCGKPLGRWTDQIHIGGNTSPAVIPVTGYLPALKLQEIRAATVVVGMSCLLQTRLYLQTANVSPETPNAWIGLGQGVQGERKDCTSFNVSAHTNPNDGVKPLFIRFGLGFKLVSGNDEAYASAGVDLVGRWG